MATDAALPLPADASETLKIMAEAARAAGEGLLVAAQATERLRITEKTAGDFVSDADRAAEATIAEVLGRAFPDNGWLAEETGARDGTAGGLRWIVDPLDGTTNFLKGLPHWAVSIALYDGDAARAALIHDPVKSETFVAEAGKGASLNAHPIRVSQGAALQSSLLATGVPAGGRVTYLPHCLDDLADLMPRTAGVRRWGAAALDLAYVAAGRFDAYWERNLGAWDIAAGVLIVTEAGGAVRPLWEGRSLLSSGAFLAGPDDLVTAVMARLNRTPAPD